MTIQITTNSFYKRTVGQRDTPYIFFYLIPLFTIARTNAQDYCSVYLGWFYWNLKITFKRYDYKRRIPK
jgi:hypothetical protein